jgi:hypothetical protein
VKPRQQTPAEVDVLHGELLAAGERSALLREVLAARRPDESLLVAVLRRAVPVKLLETLAALPPWSDTPRVLGAVVLNPKAPNALALRLLSALFWRDLAEVARTPRLLAAVRLRAEALLVERLPELRLGDRITLGRLATPAVLRRLLLDGDARVARASLLNPRLRESDLVEALQKDGAPVGLLREAAASQRWSESYEVRLALALQARTPLGVALAQLSSLLPRDLLRIAETPGLTPLVQISALRVAQAGRAPRP